MPHIPETSGMARGTSFSPPFLPSKGYMATPLGGVSGSQISELIIKAAKFTTVPTTLLTYSEWS
jgi:hypothetical protein